MKKWTILLAILLAAAAMLLAFSSAGNPRTGAPPETAPSPETSPLPEGGTVTVSTVDELLAAIGPERVICLEPGLYDLSTAADYGQSNGPNKYYDWEEVYEGWELVLQNLWGLEIRGAEREDVLLCAVPRLANVLCLHDCSDISLSGMCLGHTAAPGICAGGVLDLNNCEDIRVDDCGLFGCGTWGITARSSQNLRATASEIYNCKEGAVDLYSCQSVTLDDCCIRNCGGGSLVTAANSQDVFLLNSTVRDNSCLSFLENRNSRNLQLLGCEVRDNYFAESLFAFSGFGPLVDNCAFRENDYWSVYPQGRTPIPARDREGQSLDEAALLAMTREGRSETLEWTGQASPGGETGGEVHVQTVDEFLAAIAPGTVVYLDGKSFDLTKASNYGGEGGAYYYWEACYDGPQLIIDGISDFFIVGQGKDSCAITAEPRYATVLTIRNGRNVGLENLTMGHEKEQGACTGDVLALEDCEGVSIKGCGLFGCGVCGVNAGGCTGLEVVETEIYECSGPAVSLYQCDGVSFTACSVHDCQSGIMTYDCGAVQITD